MEKANDDWAIVAKQEYIEVEDENEAEQQTYNLHMQHGEY